MRHPDLADPSRRGFLVGAGLALATSAVDGVAPVPDIVPADVERWMRLANVPGLAMATVQGRRVETRGWGVRRVGAPASVDGDTVFEAASLTKPVFAYLVHSLALEAVLDLDRPVREYLALPDAADTRAATITARHLLGHAGGWRNWRFGPQQRLTADFEPGSRWSYSGEGYFFLQRVLEARMGRSVARLLRERVLAPLGMTRSALLWTPALDATLASPHSNRGVPMDSVHVGRVRAMRAALEKAGTPADEWSTAEAERTWPSLEGVDNVLPNNLLPNVAASLFTTARDYGAFLAHLFGDPAAQAMLERMQAPVATMNDALTWGAGVGVERDAGQATFWQWGDNSGFKHFLLGDAEARTAWVVFTNGNAGRNVYERVLRAATGRDHAAFLWI